VVGRLDSSLKPLTVGAWCKPDAAEGVVISQGGGSHGFSLYLKDGLPQFALRSKGSLAIVSAKEKVPLGEWVHLVGALNARGEIHLRVNSKSVGMAKSGPIAAKPFDRMEVGDDSSNRVAEYGAATAWRGLIEDVRVYWGELEAEKIEAWAGK